EVITVCLKCIKHVIGSTGMHVIHVFSSSGPVPAIMSGQHAIVGNAGEKYLLALRYFASGSQGFRIATEIRKKVWLACR
ncbi:hypothetical protein AGJ42_20785, partial [Cronobacter dublinensis subsp. dublinensis]|nr:hypothetical protein [Cronobacter dublinensis subsp. dublinensis]